MRGMIATARKPFNYKRLFRPHCAARGACGIIATTLGETIHRIREDLMKNILACAAIAALAGFGCETIGGPETLDAEVRPIPGLAEYAVLGPHRLRGVLSITGLPEGAPEADIQAAREGRYTGAVVWQLQATFTVGSGGYRVPEPEVTIKKSNPEQVDILIALEAPVDQFATLTITRVPVVATLTATPQAQFNVRVIETEAKP